VGVRIIIMKENTKRGLGVIACIVLIIGIFYLFSFLNYVFSGPLEKKTACFESFNPATNSTENVCLTVEVADTERRRATGLMFRKVLNDSEGMLFVFQENRNHNFWMKNTNFPLDILWFDEEMQIVSMEKNAQPCLTNNCTVILSEVNSVYALEVNAGFADRIGLEIGKKMSLK